MNKMWMPRMMLYVCTAVYLTCLLWNPPLCMLRLVFFFCTAVCSAPTTEVRFSGWFQALQNPTITSI